jgi:hypothetical protein
MALIAAIFGSLAGIIAGIMGTVFFGASLLVGFAIYIAVSLGMIAAFCASMLLRSNEKTLAAALHESQMDADWAQYSQQQGSVMTPEERQFQDDLDTPLPSGDRRRKQDRRGSSDRRDSA